jgi:hypothetical protein
MDAIKKLGTETMQIPEARWIAIVAGLVILVAIAYYVLKSMREMAIGGESPPTDFINGFQKLRDEGKLDDDEFSRLAHSIPKDSSSLETEAETGLSDKQGQMESSGEVPDFEEEPDADG